MNELSNLVQMLIFANMMFKVDCSDKNFENMEFSKFNHSTFNLLKANFTENNESNKNELTLYYESLGNIMTAILSPILLVIGALGNPLCILILLRKKKRSSTVVYLCILAIFDFLVLYTGLLRQYVNQIWNIDIRNISQIFCKLHIFFTYTLMQISSYILVAVTLNRFTIIFNRSIFCQKKSYQANQNNNSLRSVFLIINLSSQIVI
ncbi:FMRFamide receptor-like [Brachionus plicatilis]|uniref:FMRFamide receptor-like n=1 Tax=Brachionus plicatilis TaxID=10195 RepID=A0A3M7SYV4_BRAPC|nr:FMRFamide receptor-like [Brachionus plicatilis]